MNVVVFMSICLVQYFTAGFTVRNIAAWLSAHSGSGPCSGKLISPLMDWSQAACFPVPANSIYSASPTEHAMVFCHCDAKDFPSGKCYLMWCDDLCSHQIVLQEYMELKLYDPSNYWQSWIIHAIITQTLCTPVLLGLPFLVHNHIVVGYAEWSVIDRKLGFDLLNPKPPMALPHQSWN